MSRYVCACLLAAAGLVGAAGEVRSDPPLPVPLPPPTVYPAPPVELSPAPLPDRPLTLCEFANTFKPAPGSYSVCLIHPTKCCPVNVCFTLPCGCPQVRVCKRDLIFDYGCKQVKIHFWLLCCKASVSYR